MDQGIEFQQDLSDLPFGVLLLRAPSNRLADLQRLVSAIIDALAGLGPGQVRRVGS
jgi:hypothetical protein